MEPHAGFAAAIALGQEALQAMVGVLYANDLIGHTIETTIDLTASGAAFYFDTRLFLDLPRITLTAAGGGSFQLDLRAWGPMEIQIGAAPRTRRTVLLELKVMVQPLLILVGPAVLFGFVAASATVADPVVVRALSGKYPSEIQNFLEGDAFRVQLQEEVQKQLGDIQPTPLPLMFLGDLATSQGRTLKSRVVNGALLMGIDVNAEGVETQGDVAALTDFRGGRDLAYWIHPGVTQVAFKTIYDEIKSAVAAEGARLPEPPSVRVEEGRLHVEARAERDDGSASFSFDLVPHLVRNFSQRIVGEHGVTYSVDSREELWFESINQHVEASPSAGGRAAQIILGIFTLGLLAVAIQAMVDAIRLRVEARISAPRVAGKREQRLTIMGTKSPTIRLRIETYEVHARGVFSSITLRPELDRPQLYGRSGIAIDELARVKVPFTVALPFGLLPRDDTLLRVRWTVRRLDRNETVLNLDRRAYGNLTLDLDLSAPDLVVIPRFNIACRVYRPLGEDVEELFNASMELRVADNLDRTHPYVRWRHTAMVPSVVVEEDGSLTTLGFGPVDRVSDIHRTAVPGRCLFAAQYSSKVARRPEPGSDGPVLEYLDDLPFPRAELARNRALVCDYCFFGGPTRTRPLI